MKLSIIMRTWNRIEYTIRSIVSIYEKSGLNPNFYEIIVVDMGSTDGTREWLTSATFDGFYPIVPVLLDENVGDGLGMQEGIKKAAGYFIAQHDNDIQLTTPGYYHKMICLYEKLEKDRYNPCAVGGSHRQGINFESAPLKFGNERYKNGKDCIGLNMRYSNNPRETMPVFLHYSAWVTASFVFRKKFAERPFTKRMCNTWCGDWWDAGYNNFICPNLQFWHIDSTIKGGEYVSKQAKKFPSYKYVHQHCSNFINHF